MINLSAGVLSQNPKQRKRRWRKRKSQRSNEALVRWMERRIQFYSHEGVAALNQTEAAQALGWHYTTVYRHWKAAKGILEARGYVFNRAHDKSRCAKTHKRSKNFKLIWYITHKENSSGGKLFEKNRDGKCRYLRNSSLQRINGQRANHSCKFGGYIGGFVNNKAQINLKPCVASLRDSTHFEKKSQKAIWKLDRKLRAIVWDNCKVDLLPTHTHSLAKEAFRMGLLMEDVVKIAEIELYKWHGIATDNDADKQNLWLSTGWLVDCRKQLHSCQRFTKPLLYH